MIDLDNTLADRQQAFEHWVDHLVRVEPRAAELKSWIIDSDQDGFAPREEFLGELRQRLDFQQSVVEMLSEYRRITTHGFPPADPGAILRLEKGRRNGAKVAVVTNGDARAQQATLERTGLTEHVDAMVVSDAVGVAKPHRRIFEIAAARAGAELDGAWMIGDSTVDIIGGQRCGATTVWLDRGRQWPDGVPAPDHQVPGACAALDLWLADILS